MNDLKKRIKFYYNNLKIFFMLYIFIYIDVKMERDFNIVVLSYWFYVVCII